MGSCVSKSDLGAAKLEFNNRLGVARQMSDVHEEALLEHKNMLTEQQTIIHKERMDRIEAVKSMQQDLQRKLGTGLLLITKKMDVHVDTIKEIQQNIVGTKTVIESDIEEQAKVFQLHIRLFKEHEARRGEEFKRLQDLHASIRAQVDAAKQADSVFTERMKEMKGDIMSSVDSARHDLEKLAHGILQNKEYIDQLAIRLKRDRISQLQTSMSAWASMGYRWLQIREQTGKLSALANVLPTMTVAATGKKVLKYPQAASQQQSFASSALSKFVHYTNQHAHLRVPVNNRAEPLGARLVFFGAVGAGKKKLLERISYGVYAPSLEGSKPLSEVKRIYEARTQTTESTSSDPLTIAQSKEGPPNAASIGLMRGLPEGEKADGDVSLVNPYYLPVRFDGLYTLLECVHTNGIPSLPLVSKWVSHSDGIYVCFNINDPASFYKIVPFIKHLRTKLLPTPYMLHGTFDETASSSDVESKDNSTGGNAGEKKDGKSRHNVKDIDAQAKNVLELPSYMRWKFPIFLVALQCDSCADDAKAGISAQIPNGNHDSPKSDHALEHNSERARNNRKASRVSRADVILLCRQFDLVYYECSALAGTGCYELIHTTIRHIVNFKVRMFSDLQVRVEQCKQNIARTQREIEKIAGESSVYSLSTEEVSLQVGTGEGVASVAKRLSHPLRMPVSKDDLPAYQPHGVGTNHTKMVTDEFRKKDVYIQEGVRLLREMRRHETSQAYIQAQKRRSRDFAYSDVIRSAELQSYPETYSQLPPRPVQTRRQPQRQQPTRQRRKQQEQRGSPAQPPAEVESAEGALGFVQFDVDEDATHPHMHRDFRYYQQINPYKDAASSPTRDSQDAFSNDKMSRNSGSPHTYRSEGGSTWSSAKSSMLDGDDTHRSSGGDMVVSPFSYGDDTQTHRTSEPSAGVDLFGDSPTDPHVRPASQSANRSYVKKRTELLRKRLKNRHSDGSSVISAGARMHTRRQSPGTSTPHTHARPREQTRKGPPLAKDAWLPSKAHTKDPTMRKNVQNVQDNPSVPHYVPPHRSISTVNVPDVSPDSASVSYENDASLVNQMNLPGVVGGRQSQDSADIVVPDSPRKTHTDNHSQPHQPSPRSKHAVSGRVSVSSIVSSLGSIRSRVGRGQTSESDAGGSEVSPGDLSHRDTEPLPPQGTVTWHADSLAPTADTQPNVATDTFSHTHQQQRQQQPRTSPQGSRAPSQQSLGHDSVLQRAYQQGRSSVVSGLSSVHSSEPNAAVRAFADSSDPQAGLDGSSSGWDQSGRGGWEQSTQGTAGSVPLSPATLGIPSVYGLDVEDMEAKSVGTHSHSGVSTDIRYPADENMYGTLLVDEKDPQQNGDDILFEFSPGNPHNSQLDREQRARMVQAATSGRGF